jgi:ABC-2 type transport system permease protein
VSAGTAPAAVLPAAGPALAAPAGGLRRAVRDGLLVAGRDVSHWVREPQMILWGLAFPVLTVLLFAYVFGSGIVVPGGGDYREFLMPGIFVQTMAFGIGETLAAVQADAAKGVTDRFRSMPIAPSAVVVGRSLAAMLYSVASLLLMVGCGLAIGWRWRGSTTEALAALGLLLLLRFAFLWIGILLGLKARTPEAANAAFGLLYPVTMLSNAFVAPELMPGWLAVVVEWNPLSSTITTTRELFGNPVGAATSWPGEHAGALSVVWPLLLTAVFLPLAVRAYRGLSR